MSAPETAHLDFESWLAFEEASPTVRHELVGGNVYAVTGALRRHNLLATSILSAVRGAAMGEGCRSYVSDMKVRAGADGYYPDVMVACGEPPDDRFEDAPCLLVEVVSPSTSTVDRREKLAAYTRIPTLRTYLIAHPDTPRIEVHRRHGDTWAQSVLGPGDIVALECPTVGLAVDALYEGVA